jgi:hypothetical protein
MAIKRTDFLIRNARVLAQAEDWGPDYGVSDNYLVRQLNHAKIKLQRQLTITQSQPTIRYTEIVANNSDNIPVPSDCFANNLVYSVEYSSTGNPEDYFELAVMYEHGDNRDRLPQYYMAEGDTIYFDSKVASGKFRIGYEGTFDELDIRRGEIQAASGYTLTLYSGVANHTDADDAFISSSLGDYACILSNKGVVVAANYTLSSYDTSTHIATFEEDVSSIPVGSFLVIGFNATTHPKGPDLFGDYYEEYLRWEIEKARSSLDSNEANQKLATIMAEIVEIYDQLPSGRTLVPCLRRG